MGQLLLGLTGQHILFLLLLLSFEMYLNDTVMRNIAGALSNVPGYNRKQCI